MESCESLVEDPDPLIAAQEIQTVFRDFLPPNLLPDGLVEASVTCLQQYVQSKVQGSNPLARSGVFWVNMGLLQIKVWTPQTIFDPAVKRAYKLNYAQQEVSNSLVLVLTQFLSFTFYILDTFFTLFISHMKTLLQPAASKMCMRSMMSHSFR